MVRLSVAVVLLLVGCRPARPPAAPATPAPTARASLKRAHVETSYAVAVAAGADVAALEKLARERGPSLAVSRATLAELVSDDALALLARGLSAADLDGLRASPVVIVLRGAGSDGVKLAREIAGVTRDVADAARGWVLDLETFRIHPAARFHAHVPGARLDARRLIAVHVMQGENQQPYLDTAGLRRYGLPELYVAEAASGQIDALTHLINGAAQVLLDGGDVDRGELAIDFHRLGWDVNIIEQGTGKAVWKTRWARGRDAADASAPVLELVPPGSAGVVGASEMIFACFGAEPDTVTYLAKDDPELLAAAERARADLVTLRRRNPRGLPFDERLTIKAKFTGERGEVEWMWVDVVAMTDGAFEGTLANEPAHIPSLRHGARVKVPLADVADYLREQRGRVVAGGYSLEVMKKRGLLPAD